MFEFIDQWSRVYNRRRLREFELHKPYRRRVRMGWQEEMGKYMSMVASDMGGLLGCTRRISDRFDV